MAAKRRVSTAVPLVQDERADAIHDDLAAVGENDGHDFLGFSGALQFNGLCKLCQLGGDGGLQFGDEIVTAGLAAHDLQELLQADVRLLRPPPDTARDSELAGQQITALSGLGVLHNRKEIDEGAAHLARGEHFFGRRACALQHPEGQGHHRQQGRDAERRKERRDAHQRNFGYRHSYFSQKGRQLAPAAHSCTSRFYLLQPASRRGGRRSRPPPPPSRRGGRAALNSASGSGSPSARGISWPVA